MAAAATRNNTNVRSLLILVEDGKFDDAIALIQSIKQPLPPQKPPFNAFSRRRHYEKTQKHKKTTDALLRRMCACGTPLDKKHTVLHVAIELGAPIALVRLLLEHVGSNQQDMHGRTPTYLAARHDCALPVMDLLVLEHAGAISAGYTDKYSFTPLMASSFRRASLRLVGRLIKLGADIAAKDRVGRTAADWARTVNPELPAGKPDNGLAIAQFLDSFQVSLVLVQALDVPRLRKQSKLGMLPKDLIRLVRDALARVD